MRTGIRKKLNGFCVIVFAKAEITEANCLESARVQFGPNVPDGVSTGTDWAHLPSGCSVRFGPDCATCDYAVHYNSYASTALLSGTTIYDKYTFKQTPYTRGARHDEDSL